MRKSVVVIIAFLMLILSSGLSMILTNSSIFVSAAPLPGHAKSGPYVENIVYKVITQDDQQVLALQDNEIDLIGNMIDPTFLDTLTEAEDVDVANVLRNGYGYVTINTAKNPLNYTSFRRALAFALDKEAISDDVWDGLSQPHDSCIPIVNPWTIEGQLSYSYYAANVALGNDLLDAAGFTIDGVTGFRTTPNGDAFDVLIEVAQSSNIAIEIGQKVAEALTALDVEATSVPTDFYEYLNRLYFHQDYDIVFTGNTFDNFDVNWLAYEYWSENADEPYYNFPNFQNATYDSWRDQLLHATDYDEVYEAAIEMQRVFVYECPIIVCYENILLSAYRTDKFEGHINDVSDGVPGWWTNYKVHLKDAEGGPFGGTFRVSNALDIDSFNFMVSSSAYAERINNMMWDSLIRVGPDGTDMNWLTESYIAETHADNPDIPDGYTQFTFNMIQNATWTDGMPLTANDVAFTLNYYRDAPGNPYGADLTDLVAAYAPTTYQLVVQFNSESYWHLHTIVYKLILPKHIFQVIGVDNWNLWNPDPPTTPMVTSGPFNVSDYVAGEFTELTYNPNYFYGQDFASPAYGPILNSPSDTSYLEGTTGHSILWAAYDFNPATYVVERDGLLYESGSWDGSDIEVNIDGLSPGTYEFNLTVADLDSNTISDSVVVEVVDYGGKIVFDYSHGQYSSYQIDTNDLELKNNLTALGYDVVWAMGGINSSILADAAGFVAGSQYGETTGYTEAEYTAIAEWFNTGNKFMWVGYDSDYEGNSVITNMTTMLEGVNSHVYGEPVSIEDPESNCAAGYRAVANETSEDLFVADIVANVEKVLMHGPTLLYGSTSGVPEADAPVALEATTIENVYPLLYYSEAATIVNNDLIDGFAHTTGDVGSFVATTVEVDAGADGTGIIIVSGSSPYGNYIPMYEDYYRDVTLTGYLLVLQAIRFGMNQAQYRDTEKPLVDHPTDISFDEGLSGYTITWNPTDDNPYNYTILKDDVECKSGPWNSSSEAITFLLDGLPMGEYNFTIVLYDTFGNNAHDSLNVTVFDSSAPSIDDPDDLLYYFGETGNTIDWTTSDPNPSSYELYMNDELDESGTWDGSSFLIDVDGLSAGIYYYNLTLYDDRSNSAFDVVKVTVIPDDPPAIDSPDDILYYLGETGNTIDWTTGDLNPSSYELYVDDVLIDSGTWDGSSFSIDIDGLTTGTYSYNLTLYDDRSNSVFDVVEITVIPDDSPTIDSPDDILYYLGDTGNVIEWGCSDIDPSHYELYLGSMLIASEAWDGSSLSFNIDGLGAGTYTMNLTVYDDASNWIYDVVEINVLHDNPPTLDSPDDILFYAGETGTTIDWTASDVDPLNYELYVDDVLVASGTWDGSSFSIDIDELSAGIYFYNLTVYDSRSNSVFDVVEVTVLPDDSPALNSPDDILYYLDDPTIDIVWLCSDIDPLYYSITRDGVIIESGPWDGSPISISFDGLSDGVYSFNLTLYDTRSHTSFDVVEVTVLTDDAPTIDSPADFSYIIDDTGNYIVWIPNDDNDPSGYEIYRDGILVDSGTWDGSMIPLNVDGLPIGTYSYNLTVIDDRANSAFDIVNVTVTTGDINPPIVDSPADVSYEVDETGNSISWSASDDYPATYQIFRNGTQIESGDWTSSESLTIDVDGLAEGVYNFTIVLYDDAGNSASDGVVVTVTSPTTPTTTDPTSTLPTNGTITTTLPDGTVLTIITLVMSVGSAGVIVVVIIIFLRGRRGA